MHNNNNGNNNNNKTQDLFLDKLFYQGHIFGEN